MKTTRRRFLVGSVAVVGGGGLFACQDNNSNSPLAGMTGTAAVGLTAYVLILANNRVQIAVPRSEMGQGVTTTLAMLVAEELELSLADVDVFHPPPHAEYGNIEGLVDSLPFAPEDDRLIAKAARISMRSLAQVLGIQMTGASSSAKDAWEPMRHAGAHARLALLAEASERWNIPVAQLRIEKAHIIWGEKSLSFADLASGATAQRVSATPKVRADWRLIGRSIPRLDLDDKVSGKAQYAIDIEPEGLLFAAMRQSPHLGSSINNAQTRKAKQSSGVQSVVVLDDAVVVVATTYWQAKKAVDLIEFQSEDASYPDTEELYEEFSNLLVGEVSAHEYRSDGPSMDKLGDLKPSDMECVYFAPYLAHTAMEPMSCTIIAKGETVECWYGAQIPTAVVDGIARIHSINKEQVTLHVPLLGGAFGRRLESDIALYAAKIALELPGQAIKLIWTREEDTTHDFYRPAAMAKIRVSLGRDGIPSGFVSRLVVQPVWNQFSPRNFFEKQRIPDATVAFGLFEQPYAFAQYQMDLVDPEISFPVGNWRSVGHSYNAFFIESALDEAANKSSIDPFDLREKLLAHDSNALAVLDKLKILSGWHGPIGDGGTFRGMAFHRCFGTYTGHVVDIEVVGHKVFVRRVFCVIDPGQAINPDVIKAQIEGGIVFGLSSALMQEITITDGKVDQTNFHDFPALRINQMPKITMALLDNQETIGGVGEVAVPGVVPALTNAIYAATQNRVRRLPIARSGFEAG